MLSWIVLVVRIVVHQVFLDEVGFNRFHVLAVKHSLEAVTRLFLKRVADGAKPGQSATHSYHCKSQLFGRSEEVRFHLGKGGGLLENVGETARLQS